MTAAHVNQLLQVADRLPAELRGWLVSGLQAWQQGRDLEAALGLQEDVPTMPLRERDDLIRAAIRLSPGASESAQAAFFIDCMSGQEIHPDATGNQFVRILRDNRVYVPTTIRHLRRILAGRRQDGWRAERTSRPLCPTNPIPENWGIVKSQGKKYG